MSSLSWSEEQPLWRRGGGSNFRRCSPRPAGSAPGGRHKPLSASPRRTVAAGSPGRWRTAPGAGRLLHASLSPAAGGGQAPSWLRARAVPARGGLQRPSVPARRPHTSASRRYPCLLPVRSRTRLAREGLRSQGRAGTLRAVATLGGGGGVELGGPGPVPCRGAAPCSLAAPSRPLLSPRLMR